jgi:PAS domain S-box-containing protein
MNANLARFAVQSTNFLIVGGASDTAAIAPAVEANAPACLWSRIATPEQYAASLRDRAWSAVIYGEALTDFSAKSALIQLHQTGLDVPFIIVDDSISEEIASDLLDAGANDVLRHGKLGWLMPVLRREIKPVRARSDRHGAMAALCASEARFHDFAVIASDSLWETDFTHRITYASEQGLRALGLSSGDVIAKTRWAVAGATGEEPEWHQHRADLAARRPFRNFRYAAKFVSGRQRHFSVSGAPIRDGKGVFAGYRGATSEITAEVEAKRAEQAARSQLLDAIEALSDGFALFDADDRLILANSKYSAPPNGIPVKEFDVPYETYLREQILPRFNISNEHENDEAWLAWRLDRHRNPQGPMEIESHSGNWQRVLENRTREGGTVHIRTDITI